MSSTAPRKLPIRITSDDCGIPSVTLAGIELNRVLSRDGVRIGYVEYGPFTVPEITLTFAPGALELDFDVDLLHNLLASAEAGDVA